MSEFQTRPVYFHLGDLQHFYAVPRDARKEGRRALSKIVVALVVVVLLYPNPFNTFSPAQPTSGLGSFSSEQRLLHSLTIQFNPPRRSVATVCGLGRAASGAVAKTAEAAASRGSSAQ